MIALLMMQLAAPAAASAPQPQDCTSSEHRQLDFWLGRWTVMDAKTGKVAGQSHIESIYKGCAIRETFDDPSGFSGGSINLWDRGEREWVQFGSGSTGARMLFSGRWDGTKINLIAQRRRADAPTLLIRMNLQPLPDGAVRQWSDSSADYGVTWRPRYDYVYRRTD